MIHRLLFLVLSAGMITSCTMPSASFLPPADPKPLGTLRFLGEYRTGVFDESAAEILAYHPSSYTLFVTNAHTDSLDLIKISRPDSPTLIKSIELGASPNSVAVYGELVAVAVEGPSKQDNGKVLFFGPSGASLASVEVGPLPDMVTFSPDGTLVLTANEGEPSDDYKVDPEGSISIIDISNGVGNATVQTAGFGDIDPASLDPSVRVFGPNATLAQDLEPEYIAVSADGSTAYVTLQENNALAIVDLPSATVTAVKGLGFKNHGFTTNTLDASNKDGMISLQPWPVLGMYQPDAIDTFEVNGETFLVTANEGDARDYEGFSEETRVGKVKLDSDRFPAADYFQDPANLGRLKITTSLGDVDGDGDFDELYSYGARSFSIWNAQGDLIYDSGNLIELGMQSRLPEHFNSTNDENGSFDDRSDDKGPEPEGLVVGQVNGKPVLFLGLERIGGVASVDLSDPTAPVVMNYSTTRRFDGDPKADTAGNLGPEGLLFLPRSQTPRGRNLLVVAYEVSGSIAVFEVLSE